MFHLFLIGIDILSEGQVIGYIAHGAADIPIVIDTTYEKLGNLPLFFT